MKLSIEQIAELDRRYSLRAIKFVYEGLSYTIKRRTEETSTGQPSHVSGRQLCLGLAEYAAVKWGRLSKVVLNYNGVRTTRDFGEIVYLLISNSWLSARPEDSVTDFDDVYDFEQVFEKSFSF